jgi:hypothetical protein
MALKPQEAYLHLVTGGFDNDKRREVRKLFATPSPNADEEEDMPEPTNLDLAVGLLEEFYSIGVKEFTLDHAVQTLGIFGITIVGPDELRDLLNSPRFRLHSDGDTWSVPEPKLIENLRTQFCDCSEEALAERLKDVTLLAQT